MEKYFVDSIQLQSLLSTTFFVPLSLCIAPFSRKLDVYFNCKIVARHTAVHSAQEGDAVEHRSALNI